MACGKWHVQYAYELMPRMHSHLLLFICVFHQQFLTISSGNKFLLLPMLLLCVVSMVVCVVIGKILCVVIFMRSNLHIFHVIISELLKLTRDSCAFRK